jgi:hypothetical protein
MTNREKHRLITNNLARRRLLVESLERQYEALRDLHENSPEYKAKFRRFEKTVQRIGERS